jgi:hypothetical protein
MIAGVDAMNSSSDPRKSKSLAASQPVPGSVADAGLEVAAGGVPLLDSEPIGAYLASHRRLRGISLGELSEQTRIPLRSLERLEQGAFDGLADGFVRGFVRTVAIALGLDPEETVARLRSEPGLESGRRPIPRLSFRRVFLTVVFVGGGLLLFALGRTLLERAPVAATSAEEQLLLIRRDPVRSLAEAQGVDGNEGRARGLAAVSSNQASGVTLSPPPLEASLEALLEARETPERTMHPRSGVR